MVLLSLVVLVGVLLAWDFRDLYLTTLSHTLVEVAARYFGYGS